MSMHTQRPLLTANLRVSVRAGDHALSRRDLADRNFGSEVVQQRDELVQELLGGGVLSDVAEIAHRGGLPAGAVRGAGWTKAAGGRVGERGDVEGRQQ
ncbi:hypothetical protein [Microbacterium sp. W4I20]|uniref:hypothetical protein n=1 Tax=Microbacterium sp. W4I20 TaxID=3042262 RepID=UPI0027D850D5|nr:hypothetical protein [Microbacterium sp. W4I20]